MKHLAVALLCLCMARVPILNTDGTAKSPDEVRQQAMNACEQKYNEVNHAGDTIYLIQEGLNEAEKDGKTIPYYEAVFYMPDVEEISL